MELTLHILFSPERLSPLLALCADLLAELIMRSLAIRAADEESHDVADVGVVHLDWYITGLNAKTHRRKLSRAE